MQRFGCRRLTAAVHCNSRSSQVVVIHNPLSQDGIASCVTKFESQYFRFYSKFGIAVASSFLAEQSAVSSQLSAVSVSVCVVVRVKGQGEGRTLALSFLSWYGDCCVVPMQVTALKTKAC